MAASVRNQEQEQEQQLASAILKQWSRFKDPAFVQGYTLFLRNLSMVDIVLNRVDAELEQLIDHVERDDLMETVLLAISELQHPDEQSALAFFERHAPRIGTLPLQWRTLFACMAVRNMHHFHCKADAGHVLDLCCIGHYTRPDHPFYRRYADIYLDAWTHMAVAFIGKELQTYNKHAAAYALDALSLFPHAQKPRPAKRRVSLYLAACESFICQENWKHATAINHLCLDFRDISYKQRKVVLCHSIICHKRGDRMDLAMLVCAQLVSHAREHDNVPDVAHGFLAEGRMFAQMKQHDRALASFKICMSYVLKLQPPNKEWLAKFIEAFCSCRDACSRPGRFHRVSGQPVCKWRSCTQCNRMGKDYARCGVCNRAFYCSEACQAKDWPQHRLVCHCCSVCNVKSGKLVFGRCMTCGGKFCSKECLHTPSHDCDVQWKRDKRIVLRYATCEVCMRPGKVEPAGCSCKGQTIHMTCDDMCASIHRATVTLGLTLAKSPTTKVCIPYASVKKTTTK